jgi:TetR/AcrR family transcriptional repressor of nem operon
MPARATAQSVDRDADATRQRIIEAAFREMHRHGYQGMRLDDVLATAGITKGGLYHHFGSKKALAHAVIDTVIRAHIEDIWLSPLQATDQPVRAIIDIIRNLDDAVTDDIISLGCPLNNLAQEMSPLDEDFRQQIGDIYRLWSAGIISALEHGKRCGCIRPSLDSRETAMFILAALEGCIGMAKNAQSRDVLASCTAGLIGYLQSLETDE